MKNNKHLIFLFLYIFFSTNLIFSNYNKRVAIKKIYNYLEEIKAKENQYINVKKSQGTHLYKSFANTAHYVEDSRFSNIPLMKTAEGYLDNQAFTYDNALCLMTLILLKKSQEVEYLLEIFKNNFLIKKNGTYGLFNSYNANSFDLYFSDEKKHNLLSMGIDGDRIHLGPNIFIGLATQQYTYKTKSKKHLDFLVKMFKFVKEDITHYVFEDGTKGAPAMGFGWGAPFDKLFSTENIIDYYAFLKNMEILIDKNSIAMKKILSDNNVKHQDIIKEKTNTKRWLMEVAYNKRGTFNCGCYGPNNNGKYIIDTTEALDVNTWAIQAIGPAELEKWKIDPFELMKKCEQNIVEVTIFDQKYKGFDFTLNESAYIKKRKYELIWWEGTAQMALNYKLLANYALKKYGKKKGKPISEKYIKKYNFYINEMNRYLKNVWNNKYDALPYVANILDEKNIIWSFNSWWPIVRPKGKTHTYKYKIRKQNFGETSFVPSISSTLWRFFAIMEYNPFDIQNKYLNGIN